MEAGQKKWYQLGFTTDEVVDAFQDARLAEECVMAWRRAGRPPFAVSAAPGDATHLIHWFVDEATARVLDTERVHWRSFLIGECAGPPPDALSPIRLDGEDGAPER